MKSIFSLFILISLSSHVSTQGPWTQVTGGATQIAVDPSGNPWIVDNNHYIYRRTSTGFLKLPGLANDIGIGANGDVWVIGTDSQSGGYGIHKYVPAQNTWTQVSGGAVRIAVDPQGTPWIVNTLGYIYKRTSSGFSRLPGLATDIGIGTYGEVWIIGTDSQAGGFGVYQYSSSSNSWTQAFGGVGIRISVDPSGNPWVVDSYGSIYRRTPSGFAQLAGLGRDIGIGVGANRNVWLIGTDGQSGGYGVYYYSPEKNPWAKISGVGAQIAVTPSGLPWVINDLGYIYRRTSTGFFKLPGMASDIGIGANGDAWMLGNVQVGGGYGVYKYSSSANTWTQVSGAGVRIAVDPQGNPWVANDQGYIFKRTSSGFVELPGLAREIAIGANGVVYVIGTDPQAGGYGIHRYSSGANTWTQVSGGAVKIAVDPQGNPWIVNNQGQISRWTSAGFVQLPGAATDIAIGGSGNVWILGTTKGSGGYDIYQYVS